MMTHSHPAVRAMLCGAGGLLILMTPFAALLPGPGGIFVFAGGLALILRNSFWARRRWARLMRGWPRLSALVYRVMRRPSVRRRRERDRPPGLN